MFLDVAIVFTYLFFITLFGGCLALAGYQEQQQRPLISCQRIKSRSESGQFKINLKYAFKNVIKTSLKYPPTNVLSVSSASL